jgi:hypothetical protein
MSSEGGVVVWLGQKDKMVQDILSDKQFLLALKCCISVQNA